MNAKLCDRCGELFGETNEGVGKIVGTMELFGKVSERDFAHCIGKELCADCVSAFIQWWEFKTIT